MPVVGTPDGPDWADGIDLATAKERDWYRLMELADTEPKLRQVAKARGYHWRWAIRRMEERAEAARKREADAQEVPFVVGPWPAPRFLTAVIERASMPDPLDEIISA